MESRQRKIFSKLKGIFCPPSGNFIKEVLDINLLKFKNGEIVKLIGVVPLNASDKYSAINFIKELTKGHEITLHLDKEKYDSEGNLLAYVYIKENEDLKQNVKEAIKMIGKGDKMTYSEFMPEDYQFPKDFWEVDCLGNKSINPVRAVKEKPQGDLFLFLNATLLNYRFANFLSMPPNTGYDDYFKVCFREA